LKFSKTYEDFSKKRVWSKYSRNSKTSSTYFEISCKMERWGRVKFFQRKTFSLPYLHQNFETVHQQLQQAVQNLKRKFDNMSRFAALVFGNIASISKVEHASIGAKGLCLWNICRTWSRGCITFLLTKQENEERSKHPIENLSEVSSQKSEKSCSGWACLNKCHASPLTNILSRWIRSGITSCVGPAWRTCAG
jgi:hypothetical protein